MAYLKQRFKSSIWDVYREPAIIAMDGLARSMPGVISHGTNVIEHPEAVAKPILRFANVRGRENVVAATECGFHWRTHPQIAWAKLQALVEGALLASRKLCSGVA